MPEIKPVLNKISAFDAKNGTTISFSWSGAQSHKNRLVIKEYDSPHRTVYDCTIKTMALKHTLHIKEEDASISQKIPYGLFNGKRYLASVYVYDIYNNESLKSNDVEFYCFSTPIFEFTNFTNIDHSNTAKVSTNSIYLNVKYIQTDGEVINEYKFTLFDSFGNELISSKIFYGSSDNDNLQWTLGGITDTEKKTNGELDYNKSYSIVCEAETIHGMSLSIEQKFVVQKDMGGVGALIDLHTLPDHTVSISSNFKIVNAVIDGEEKYLNDETGDPFALDLSNGDNLSYFDGFNMTSPWAITSIVGDCQPNSILMTCTNNNGDSFVVSYIVKKYSLVEKAYFLFESSVGNTHYILRSDYLPITDKWYVIYLKYMDGYYTFRVYDPEELNYTLPEDAITDKVISNKENIFVQKNIVLSSDTIDNKLDFSMNVDFGDKYDFELDKYYTIIFSVDNIVKNNHNNFTLFKSNDITVSSDEVYVSKFNNQYIINFHCTDTLLSPKININWSNDFYSNSPKEYYRSETYCVVKDISINNILENYAPNNIYKKEIIPSAIGSTSIQNSIELDLSKEGFYFINGYKYLIRFSFKNVISNGAGLELENAETCSVVLNEQTYSGSLFEIEYVHNSDSEKPNIIISWVNKYMCSNAGGSSVSFAVIENIDVIDIEHTDILENKEYQYIFENSVSQKEGEHIDEFNADFRIDTKYLIDNTRLKDKFLNNGESYVLRFNADYLCDSYYGMFLNDDITFNAEFLGQSVSFKSGDNIEIPFIYTETADNLYVHISWNQPSVNHIESEYSKGKTYLLIDNIKYGYSELLDNNIYDYDYAAKLEIDNINTDTGSAFTKDIVKIFTGNGSYKLKELFLFTENEFNEEGSDLAPICTIKSKLNRIYTDTSSLISIDTEVPITISLEGESLEFSWNESESKYELETTKYYTNIDDDTVSNLSWNETVSISQDLSGGANKQKINVYIVVWISKSSYIEITN